jgi:hypothetical protein
MFEFLLELFKPLIEFMVDPDSVKGNVPTLHEQEAAERIRRKFLKKKNRCCSCNCKC